MSTLSSASTDADVWAAYDDNASYEEDNSPTKAAAFITACRILLRRRAQMAEYSTRKMTFESIKSEMEQARVWLSANPTSSMSSGRSTVRFSDFSLFRD